MSLHLESNLAAAFDPLQTLSRHDILRFMRCLKSRIAFAAIVVVPGLGGLSPASAEQINLTCSLTASEQATMRKLGLTPETVMLIVIDTDAGTATDGATYPGDTNPQKTTYAAKITAAQVAWSTPPDPDDGTFATRTFDRSSKVLNSVDPEGHSTLWDCR
jgi:hypothetical protein